MAEDEIRAQTSSQVRVDVFNNTYDGGIVGQEIMVAMDEYVRGEKRPDWYEPYGHPISFEKGRANDLVRKI